jgi:hypothetical protein
MVSYLQHPKADNDITGAGATPLYKQTGTPRVQTSTRYHPNAQHSNSEASSVLSLNHKSQR